jgi:hypothetical protein
LILRLTDYLLIVCVLLFIFGGGTSIAKPEKVVVVYESANFTPPAYVAGTLKDLDIDARVVDQDIETGDGQTPEYLADAIKAAKQNGLPSIVFVRGSKAISVQSLPTSEQELRELLQ